MTVSDSRSRWFLLILALQVCAFACNPPAPERAANSTATTQATDLPDLALPRDYVASPIVDPAERDAGPARIVSTAPSLTELCAAFGMLDRLVGRTQYCEYPPAVMRVPVIGAYTDANLEAIIAAMPDLVLVTSGAGKLKEKLEALDLPIAVLPDSSYEDVLTAIDQFGKLVGRPRTAEALKSNIIADVERLTVDVQIGRRVLFATERLSIPPRSLNVAGPGSVLDSFVRRAGCTNALAGRLDRPWGQISIEEVIAAAPDVIIEVRFGDDPPSEDALYDAWNVLAGVPAWENRRIRTLPQWIVVPSPRINLVMYHIRHACTQ